MSSQPDSHRLTAPFQAQRKLKNIALAVEAIQDVLYDLDHASESIAALPSGATSSPTKPVSTHRPDVVRPILYIKDITEQIRKSIWHAHRMNESIVNSMMKNLLSHSDPSPQPTLHVTKAKGTVQFPDV